MAKPIVIVTPDSDRETLRLCGVLQTGCFRSFDDDRNGAVEEAVSDSSTALYLWPYTITYALSEDWAKRVLERPVEFSVFLGMKEAGDDEELRENEVKITRLLGSTMVHVIFLDKSAENRREYAVFRSFAEIAEWSRQFKTMLDVRFRNEAALQQVENVLVIVARGGQVQTTREELGVFNACVGAEACFKSCYFLDFNLSVADSHELFHSHAVWDVMVGRLLLAFLLSREKDQQPVWMGGGIRLWRSGECTAHVSDEFCAEKVKEALGKAYAKLPDMIDDAASDAGTPDQRADSSEVFHPPALDPPALDNARKLQRDGWADFPSAACSRETASPERWRSAFDGIRTEVEAERLSRMGRGGRNDTTSAVFERSHQSPGVLFRESERIGGALRRERDELRETQCGKMAERWSVVVAAERERRMALDELDKAGNELALAQRHYVGIGPGLIVVLAISSMCGFILYRLVDALGGAFFLSVGLAGATFLGSLVAAVMTLWLHDRHGRAGTEAFIGMSKEADARMVERDERARDMVGAADQLRLRLAMQNARFRVWLLLERIKTILITEIQPNAARVESVVDGGFGLEDGLSSDARRRVDFVKLTRVPLEVSRSEMASEGMGKLRELIEEWWESPAGKNSFKMLWSGLCHTYDKKAAGHFPARVFIPDIRGFVERFKERVRREVVWQTLHEPNNLKEVAEALELWMKACMNGKVRDFCSGAISGLHDREDEQTGKKIYLRQDDPISGSSDLKSLVSGGQNTKLIFCEALKELDQQAFFYQEFAVEFDVDPETRHLTFKEVSDVR